ncbi:uncharacterized protein B0H18DRAFT_1015788, partial [Fomitopsis serialis]|uniref:uncharacterized protein n=1 Tax=Fomitopsis serialis TaxID=139415 RepID=UPI0020079AEE
MQMKAMHMQRAAAMRERQAQVLGALLYVFSIIMLSLARPGEYYQCMPLLGIETQYNTS